MKKISIIIPCYNAENCIDRCIQSLLGQTIGIENLELIFVNDASTDSTLVRLQQWEAQYAESILVIDCEKNGKQGKARNIGLSYASAPYIGFMDNDDMAEPDMFEKLYEKATLYDCDLVACYAKKHTLQELENNAVFMGRTGESDTILDSADESGRRKLLDININRAIWNKLYKKTVITENKIEFLAGNIYDDICFSELIKHYVSKVYVLEEYLYHHIISQDAASYKADDWINKLEYFDVNIVLILELRERNLYEPYRELYEDRFILEYFSCVKNFIATYGEMPAEILNMMNEQIPKLFPNYENIAVVQKLKRQESNSFYSLLCKWLGRPIDKVVMEQIVKSIKE